MRHRPSAHPVSVSPVFWHHPGNAAHRDLSSATCAMASGHNSFRRMLHGTATIIDAARAGRNRTIDAIRYEKRANAGPDHGLRPVKVSANTMNGGSTLREAMWRRPHRTAGGEDAMGIALWKTSADLRRRFIQRAVDPGVSRTTPRPSGGHPRTLAANCSTLLGKPAVAAIPNLLGGAVEICRFRRPPHRPGNPACQLGLRWFAQRGV